MGCHVRRGGRALTNGGTSRPVVFTMDLEDYRLQRRSTAPLAASVSLLLEAAERAGATGTIFVVGELAERRPDLVRLCADRGHEIALHGYRHVPIDTLGERAFKDDVARGRCAVEEAAGCRVVGYRAPLFSLTQRTPWAPSILAAEGFSYSSSILPARSPIRGAAGAPRVPFRWESGLIEFPCPVGGPRVSLIPYLGGVYMRYIPMALITRWARRASPAELLWLYCHPYDADASGGRLDLSHAGYLTTAILSKRRRGTPERVEAILQKSPGGSTLARCAVDAGRLPTFAFG
jgi:polysaccharide deacetylase family protein (PEP-CTERM system associated)